MTRCYDSGVRRIAPLILCVLAATAAAAPLAVVLDEVGHRVRTERVHAPQMS